MRWRTSSRSRCSSGARASTTRWGQSLPARGQRRRPRPLLARAEAKLRRDGPDPDLPARCRDGGGRRPTSSSERTAASETAGVRSGHRRGPLRAEQLRERPLSRGGVGPRAAALASRRGREKRRRRASRPRANRPGRGSCPRRARLPRRPRLYEGAGAAQREEERWRLGPRCRRRADAEREVPTRAPRGATRRRRGTRR